jgi:hypothetical protein
MSGIRIYTNTRAIMLKTHFELYLLIEVSVGKKLGGRLVLIPWIKNGLY